MTTFDNVALTPSPPALTDYEAATGTGKGNPCTPGAITVNKFYVTDYISEYVLFKAYLYTGRRYRIAVETSYTLGDFDEDHARLYLWSPTDWPGETDSPLGDTYNDLTDEDSGTKWAPYTSKLNVLSGSDWLGGRRYDFNCTETGYWVFMFGNPAVP